MPSEEVVRRLFLQLQRWLARPAQMSLPELPDPEDADRYGLVAVSPGLHPELVLAAYRKGIFPMAEEPGLVGWWSPDPRTILDLDAFHVPRRLARTVRQGKYELRFDTALPVVIARCAARPETWISREFQEVYGRLGEQGHVHSVEAWQGEELVGGLYGVSVGGAFMAESMFHSARDASKVAVVGLTRRLRERGFRLLDIQYETKATSVFRPRKIPRREYLERLAEARELSCTFA